MARRKRKHIPLKEKLAVALVRLLPLHEQRELRHAKGSASTVLKLFHFDHIVLHAHDGSDKWWNLDAMQVHLHREKSRRDTSIVAKVKRLRRAPQAVAGKPKLAKGGVDAPRPRRRTTGRPMAGTIASGWRKKLNGDVVRR